MREEGESQMMLGGKESFHKRARRRWDSACWIKRTLYILLLLVLLFILVILVLVIAVLIKAATISTPSFDNPSLFEPHAIGVESSEADRLARAQRLAEAISYRTISEEPPAVSNSSEAFLQLHDFLERTFPLVHSSSFVQREVVNEYSLLFTVTGSDNGDKLPYMLTSHLDVVPADPATWEEDPFDAGVVGEFVYGRGAFDDKGGVMAILEALEHMIGKKEQPRRTFYIGFGHDEEISGVLGANEIAKTLLSRGVDRLDFLLDEGYFVTREIIPGASEDIAIVGVSEKGYVTFDLEVVSEASHSSIPPWETAIGIMAEAMAKIERKKLPHQLGKGPERYTLEHVAPYVPFGSRMLYANLWLFADLMAAVMDADPLLNSIVRTTTALTIINGGIKDNVVPARCTGTVNHRIHPSQSVEDVRKFITKVVDDPRVNITTRGSREAHPVAPFGTSDVPYHMLAATIMQTFPATPVVPGLLVANTDTYWYLDFTDNVFRFFPNIMNEEDTWRFHGDNERISIENYDYSVNFFYRLFQNADRAYDHVPSK